MSTEGMIMRQVDDVISVLRFDAILFFMKAEEPCLSVWVRRSKSSEQRAGAFTEEAGSAEKFAEGNDGSPKDNDASRRRLLREWPG